MKKFSLKLNILVIALFVIGYMLVPTNLNPTYREGAFSILFMVSAIILCNFHKVLPKLQTSIIDGQTHIDFVGPKAKGFKNVAITVGVLWAFYFIATIVSTPLFNSTAYRDQIGTPVVADFSEDLQIMDLNQVPIVDKALASSLADKKLGENPGMGSQVNLGEPVIQQVNGELVWVVPLEHSGFFKWLQNRDGSAGYIKVSATNMQDVEFIASDIKYQPNSYFFDDITRHLRLTNGLVFDGLTDYSFEITDDGEPYWIITTYSNQWLFSLPEATGVITLNAKTGEVQKYSIDNVPSWVDRVQPENFIVNQIDNQGMYVHGVFNFSNKDKFQSSEETAIIYNDGNCYMFTGLTSVGADESTIGFVMVNMVTKESKIYQISGATEYAAMLSAQGEVQQYGYIATSPLIINHNGEATYFITLKDKSGLIKQYAFVSIRNVSSVGVGNTISTALRAYEATLGATNSFVTTSGETLSAEVVRIASEDLGTGLVYRLVLAENGEILDKLFVVSAEISPELAITEPGDKISIEYYSSTSGVVTAIAFDNLEFNQ